jgi:nucleoside-triphosphatase THEP1
MPQTALNPLLFIVTGSQGAGKTTFCTRMVEAAREAGWKTAGLLSRPVFEGSRRIAIQVEDLHTGEFRIMATRSETPTPGLKHWLFDPAALLWANTLLASSTPVDLLIVDELGPLEFERGEGWQAGFAALDSREFAIAFVVVRAEMLGAALSRWPDANVVEIDTPAESSRKAALLAEQLF